MTRAPVEAQGLRCGPGALAPICRTAVYVTRSYGGLGGGGREVSPIPNNPVPRMCQTEAR